MRTLTTTDAVVQHFMDVWGNAPTAYDVGPHMTCTEVGALTDLIAALGYPDIANLWLDGHESADHDDDGDQPHVIRYEETS
jgi:hypothetical protein